MKRTSAVKTRAERLREVRRMIADLETRRSVARDAHRSAEAERLDTLVAAYRRDLKQLGAA